MDCCVDEPLFFNFMLTQQDAYEYRSFIKLAMTSSQ
jgi:hypothetical protein